MNFESLPVSVLDLFVIAVVGLSVLLAWFDGGAKAVLGLAAWIGALLAAFHGYELLQPWMRERIGTPIIADLATAAVVFIVPLVVLKIVAATLARVIGGLLGPVDSWLGAVVGLARGALIVCLTYLGFTFLFGDASPPEWIRDGRTFPLVQDGTAYLRGWLPEAPADAQRALDQLGGPAEGADRDGIMTDPLDTLLERTGRPANL